jgi:flavin reductase (DIM6/NTAB) family NADH-FMN oxidoreductase RutF
VTSRRSTDGVPQQTFFEIMASFPSGVVIVTTLDPDGSPRGLTTTAVSSVSADPATVLVCVDEGSRTLAGLRARRRFVLNFIAEGRSHLCLLFASKGEDKFASVDWVGTKTGLPLLRSDALAWAECSIIHDVLIGDHAVLVARVDDGGVDPELGPPLMYYRRSWGVWTPAHDPGEPEPVAPGVEIGARDLRWQGAEI